MRTNKRRFFNRLFCLLVALFAGQSVVVSATAADDESRQREANLARTVRRLQGTAADRARLLVELGLVREQLGKFTEALATWRVLKKQFGLIKISPAPSSGPDYTGAQLADFFSQRIRRK